MKNMKKNIMTALMLIGCLSVIGQNLFPVLVVKDSVTTFKQVVTTSQPILNLQDRKIWLLASKASTNGTLATSSKYEVTSKYDLVLLREDIDSLQEISLRYTDSLYLDGKMYADTINANINDSLSKYIKGSFASTSSILNSKKIVCWGNSLTKSISGATAFPVQLSFAMNKETLNKGVGGENSTQIMNRFLVDTALWKFPTIIWSGRNNYSDTTTVKANIKRMVDSLNHDNYLVLSIINGEYTSEYKEATNYLKLTALNIALAKEYGNHFVDVRTPLVAAYDPDIAQDVIDYSHDIVPSSLRLDLIHLTTTGYAIVVEEIIKKINTLFYDYYDNGVITINDLWKYEKDKKIYVENTDNDYALFLKNTTADKYAGYISSSSGYGLGITNSGNAGIKLNNNSNNYYGMWLTCNGNSNSKGIYAQVYNGYGAYFKSDSSLTNIYSINYNDTGYSLQSVGNNLFKGKCNIQYGGGNIVGADLDTSTLTDNTLKSFTLASNHYDNEATPFMIMQTTAASNANSLLIGGGAAEYNTTNWIKFYTALSNTTTSGALRMQIHAGGGVSINTISGTACQLEVNSQTGKNIRLTYNDYDGNAVNYVDLLTTSSGDLTITPSGGNIYVNGNIAVTGTVDGRDVLTDGQNIDTVINQIDTLFNEIDTIKNTLDTLFSNVASGIQTHFFAKEIDCLVDNDSVILFTVPSGKRACGIAPYGVETYISQLDGTCSSPQFILYYNRASGGNMSASGALTNVEDNIVPLLDANRVFGAGPVSVKITEPSSGTATKYKIIIKGIVAW